jgi:hypothetical protein
MSKRESTYYDIEYRSRRRGELDVELESSLGRKSWLHAEISHSSRVGFWHHQPIEHVMSQYDSGENHPRSSTS